MGGRTSDARQCGAVIDGSVIGEYAIVLVGMKSDTTPASIVWLYDGDHQSHPIMRQALDTLAETDSDVTIIDRSTPKLHAKYEHVSVAGASGHKVLQKLSFMVRALRALFQRRHDIILTTLPSMLVVGWLGKLRSRSRLVYYPFELLGEQGARVSPVWRYLERLALAYGIDALITQNDHRARVYVEERNSSVRPAVVHNFKVRHHDWDSGRLRADLGCSAETRIVLYEGQLVHGRWLDRIVDAARFLPSDVHLVFLGQPFPWWKERVEPLLHQPPFDEQVTVLPPVPHVEVMNFVAGADVGIICYDDRSRNNVMCEPGKLSDYVFAGLPIVCPDFPTLRAVIDEYDIGRAFTEATPRAIADAIMETLAVPWEVWRPRLSRAAAEFVWETQVPSFLGAVRGVDPTKLA